MMTLESRVRVFRTQMNVPSDSVTAGLFPQPAVWPENVVQSRTLTLRLVDRVPASSSSFFASSILTMPTGKFAGLSGRIRTRAHGNCYGIVRLNGG